VTVVNHAKTAEPIEMPFGLWTRWVVRVLLCYGALEIVSVIIIIIIIIIKVTMC